MTTIPMTPELRQAIVEAGNGPVCIEDPETSRTYWLVEAPGVDEQTVAASYPAVDVAFAEGWNDPAMDVYDDYEAPRP